MIKPMITVTETKAWLRKYRDLELEADIQSERIVRLMTKIEGVKAQVITGMPSAHGGSNDRITDLIAKKIEIEDSARKAIEIQKRERARIEKAVSQMASPMSRAIIRHRYVDGNTWEKTCSLVFGKQADYDEKMDSYLRRVFLIHGDALKELTEIILVDSDYKDLDREH